MQSLVAHLKVMSARSSWTMDSGAGSLRVEGAMGGVATTSVVFLARQASVEARVARTERVLPHSSPQHLAAVAALPAVIELELHPRFMLTALTALIRCPLVGDAAKLCFSDDRPIILSAEIKTGLRTGSSASLNWYLAPLLELDE